MYKTNDFSEVLLGVKETLRSGVFLSFRSYGLII